MITGAAPIGAEVIEFFYACGVPVLEGYGMTETCAAATLNTLGEVRVGSVGRPLPGTEVSIGEDGEILMRGPHVFKGYHRNQEATDAIMSEGGWLHSGDLGEIVDGYVHITGRKKDLIITSSGKNVSPEMLESALRETRWISQAIAAGDRRSYLVALVTIDPDEAPQLADAARRRAPTRSRWRPTRRSATRSGRTSTPSTSASRGSSRSSASRSSRATSRRRRAS